MNNNDWKEEGWTGICMDWVGDRHFGGMDQLIQSELYELKQH
jgi:hypothetical protein